jgi:hypothetical protein
MAAMRAGRQGKTSFLKKRSKKLLDSGARVAAGARLKD